MFQGFSSVADPKDDSCQWRGEETDQKEGGEETDQQEGEQKR